MRRHSILLVGSIFATVIWAVIMFFDDDTARNQEFRHFALLDSHIMFIGWLILNRLPKDPV